MNYLLDIDLSETEIKAAISRYIEDTLGVRGININAIELDHCTNYNAYSMTNETTYSANIRVDTKDHYL